jgi:hypothetical protein
MRSEDTMKILLFIDAIRAPAGGAIPNLKALAITVVVGIGMLVYACCSSEKKKKFPKN